MISTLWQRRSAGDRYSLAQIVLHWLVVILVFVQWMTYDAIHRTHSSILPPLPADLLEHAIHTYAGMSIGVLMALRLVLRLWRGTPPQAEGGWRGMVAAVVHGSIYAALFAQAGSGFVATYLWGGAGRIHVLLWNAILVLLALHLAGVAYHLLRRDGVASRMFRPRRS